MLGVARTNEKLKADGMVLIQHAPSLAERLTDVARDNEQVYKVLVFLMSSSVYGALLLEVAGIAMAIAANHGVNVPINPAQAQGDMSGVFAAMQAQNGNAA